MTVYIKEMKEMIKVDIFSGFLGAGKTTLIKKLIAEAYGDEKLVLIENEFGEIGVDSGFLKDTGIEINEMNAGCICCTLVGDFSKALKDVAEQYHPDRILIEPSGVGKLSDVILAVKDADCDELELNSFTTVVDAKRCKSMIRSFGEFYINQLENASSVVLSHQAGMSDEKLHEVIDIVREHNATCSIVTTDWTDIDGAKILKVMEDKSTMELELDKLRAEAHHEHEHHHHHDGECDCGHEHEHEHHHHDGECSCGCGHDHHGHHHADEVFDEMACHTANKYSKKEMEEILDSLDECGEVLRAKGIVECPDSSWLEFDYVPGEGEVREGSKDATGTIIVIGTGLKKDKLAKLFRL